ncbi:MAG: YceG family protein [Oscillospiraceae bacterium]|nr:YceG family protein [Oscillospiraceae bacterium]
MAIKFGNNNENAPVVQNTAPSPVPATGSVSAFTRYIGYTDAGAFEKKLIDLYAKTKQNGVFIDRTIPNPSNPEISKISSVIDINAQLNAITITEQIRKIKSARLMDLSKIGHGPSDVKAAEVIDQVLADIKNTSASANAVKNFYLKFICWFIRYSTYKLTNLLYIGDISKSEIYWLYILSRMGCTVSYVNYTSDDSYTAVDSTSRYSSLIKGTIFAPLDIEFGKINMAAYTQAAKINETISRPSDVMLKFLQTASETLSKDLLTTMEERKCKLMCTDSTIPVYFLAYLGFQEEVQYKNMLYILKEDIPKKNKPLIFLDELKKPTYEEAADYYSIQKTNDATMIGCFAAKISISDRFDRTLLAQKAFVKALSSFKSNNLYNTAVQLSVWIRKFSSSIDYYNKDIPAIMYYGTLTQTEMVFLSIMSQTGFDIFYFSPDKSALNIINSVETTGLQLIECSGSAVSMPFPERITKAQMATDAYNAERSLDNILYNDTTMFRNRQFASCVNQTLKTTYEEMGLMWHQEAMFRTGFDKRDDYVVVPNIFAKINGIAKGDTSAYAKEISMKLSPYSVYYNRIPFYKPILSNDDYRPFYSGLKIDVEKLKHSRFNKYDYLSDDLQYLIFNKMQEIVDSGFINVPPTDIVPLVIKTGLNIPAPLLNLLQSFDFTKNIPKIVIVSSAKQTFAVFECILLLFFNMVGFDIIVYTPTGYKNLDAFIKPEAFQTFVMSDFNYTYNPPRLSIPKEIPREKSSLFGRLFKGKK